MKITTEITENSYMSYAKTNYFWAAYMHVAQSSESVLQHHCEHLHILILIKALNQYVSVIM